MRAFAASDLVAFASISGDRNPLHVDPEVARRTMTGEQTMHGVLGVLWALDCALADGEQPLALTRLTATFRRPVVVDETIGCGTPSAAPGTTTKAIVEGAGRIRFEVSATWASARPEAALPVTGPAIECRELDLDQLATREGALPLYVDVEQLARMLPYVAGRLSSRQLAFILATTRLVGMECPGLHSLYVALDLTFDEAESPSEARWCVKGLNHNHGRVVLDITCGGMRGTLTTFIRPRPVLQPSSEALGRLVQPAEFAGQRALIVGGSRGLGEVSAKLIASGGGDVVLTYHLGSSDAARVVDEIRAAGGRASSIRVDVLRAEHFHEVVAEWAPTELHYFASPRIDFGRAGTFAPVLFRRFCDYYVEGYVRVRSALHAATTKPLRVLYASSEAIDSTEPGAEYAAAKAAGEVTSAQLARHFRDTLYAPRFPRLQTDQSANVLSLPAGEPAPVVLAALRRLRDQ